MIVEVRSYRIKPGKRDEFIRLFEKRAVPAQRTYGMQIIGPLSTLRIRTSLFFCAASPHSRSATA